MDLIGRAKRILELKGCTEENFDIQNNIQSALLKKYNAVCMSIDGTLVEDEDISEEAVRVIFEILNKHVPIVFITGRGENGGIKLFVKSLIDRLQKNYNISYDLLRNIIGISNDGCFLYYTSGNNIGDYLDKFHSFVSKEELKKIELFNQEILEDEIFDKFLFSNSFCPSMDNVLANIRIILNTEEDIDRIRTYLEKKVKEDKYEGLTYVFGVFRGKNVVQIGLTDKGSAINETEKFLGIPRDSILRIGSQGDINGSDYSMLNCLQGFSTSKFSKDPNSCLVAINNNGEMLVGISATIFLLKNLNIFPTVCLERPDRKRYISQLASVERDIVTGKNESMIRYNDAFNKNFNTTGGFSDIFDNNTGGIIFKDWEWELLRDNNELKKLFEENEYNYSYLLNTDDSKILRGSETYYYFLAHRVQNLPVSDENVHLWCSNNINFLTKAKEALKDYIITDSGDVKLLLGVLDNIRNLSLIMLNSAIKVEANDNNMFLSAEDYSNDSEISAWYNMCEDTYHLMHSLCFKRPILNNVLNGVERLITSVLYRYENSINNILDMDDVELNEICFRRFREIDNYIENFITVDLAIEKIQEENPDLLSCDVNFIGVAYGGLELPFLAKSILNKRNIHTSIISLNGKYANRHKDNSILENELADIDINTSLDLSKCYNVIMDDNVLTGKTLQIVLNLLFSNKIDIDDCIVVRYPSINRIDHMFLEGHGAIDTSKFFTFIKGLSFPSPYTKIMDNAEDKYKDEFGIFNITRDMILRYLFKNGNYEAGSEVFAMYANDGNTLSNNRGEEDDSSEIDIFSYNNILTDLDSPDNAEEIEL